MNSMFVPGAWWPVSRQTTARSPSATQWTYAVPQSGHVGGVERRLEELVLEHEPLIGTEAGVDLGQRVGEPVLPVAQVALARIVEAVGQPDLEVAAAGHVHDVDALEHVGDRLGPDPLVDVGEAARACSRRPGTCSC